MTSAAQTSDRREPKLPASEGPPKSSACSSALPTGSSRARICIEWGLIALFLLLILLPGLQMARPIVLEEKLHGVEAPVEHTFPSLTWSSLLDESFQKDVNVWLNEHFGFRGALVRTDNQLNFSLFREISSSYGSRIIVGKWDTLFEKLYLDAVNGRYKVSPESQAYAARQFLRLFRVMQAQKKTFLVFITPNKASVYPELIPSRFVRTANQSTSSDDMDGFVRLLESEGVPVLDTRRLMDAWKSSSPFPVFPKGGSHWTEFTACRAGKELMRRLKQQSAQSWKEPDCEPYRISDYPGPFDRDLADLTNLWNPAPFFEPLPYVDLPKARPLEGERPSMFFVGGSFLWAVFNQFEQQSIYRSRDFFYYYERRFRWPERIEEKIRKSQIPWKDEILRNDTFVIEINEAYLHHAGMGFVRDAIRSLAPSGAGRDEKSEASDTGTSSQIQ